jgi:hypothetical protein
VEFDFISHTPGHQQPDFDCAEETVLLEAVHEITASTRIQQ